jgi:hypothetical protein
VTHSSPRRAIARTEAPAVAAVTKIAPEPEPASDEDLEKIDSDALSDGGKLYPQQGFPGGAGVIALPPGKVKKPAGDEDVAEGVTSKLFVPIMKADKERRTICGVVLEPDTVDAHKDTIPADVILDAAEDFLANINVKTTMGVMHKDLKAPLELVQSFVVPDSDITINSVLVKKGSWVITVRVNSDDIWQQIKDGKLTGFSIGGKARVQSLKPQAVV